MAPRGSLGNEVILARRNKRCVLCARQEAVSKLSERECALVAAGEAPTTRQAPTVAAAGGAIPGIGEAVAFAPATTLGKSYPAVVGSYRSKSAGTSALQRTAAQVAASSLIAQADVLWTPDSADQKGSCQTVHFQQAFPTSSNITRDAAPQMRRSWTGLAPLDWDRHRRWRRCRPASPAARPPGCSGTAAPTRPRRLHRCRRRARRSRA